MRGFLTGVMALVLSASPAVADDDPEVGTGLQGLFVHREDHGNEFLENGQSGLANAPVYTELTMFQEFCQGVNWTRDCESNQNNGEVQVNWGWEAFKTVPLPASGLVVQPPGGRTLVNFETNFYTDAPAVQSYAVPILDQVVELRVRPIQFTWHFGDGRARRTESPGSAYPELEITHSYLSVGEVGPSLDTTYGAVWRLQGSGPWRPVPGTVMIPGQPVLLAVVEATPTLVG